ncbi:MAG: 2OG-Fe(II) oxygenase [Cyclobacteriaceae bacterium]
METTIKEKLVFDQLNESGFSILPNTLGANECKSLISLYEKDSLYRSIISMQRYRFGKGEYKYFDYPLPPIVEKLRTSLYPSLSKLANEWMTKLNIDSKYPVDHSAFIEICKSKKQNRPTPLILKYESGDFNTLHQDLYGEVSFPFQVIISLTQRNTDYEGGELVLTEQVPRAQSKAMVITPNLGDAVIVTTNFRPVLGTRGYYRANLRHGVSEVKSGRRFTLGIVFHDAA